MFDAKLRPLIDRPLDKIARLLTGTPVTANMVTFIGFIFGVCAAVAILFEAYLMSLSFILINRIFDGLDGAIARQKGTTDYGGYLDILLDFIFYNMIPAAFIVTHSDKNAVAGVFLMLSFVGTGVSFLAYAILAEKRKVTTELRGKKSFYYLGGLTEGTETIILFILLCLFPQHFPIFAFCFGALCWVTTLFRVYSAYLTFKE